MKNNIEKIVRNFISFGYSKRTNDLFHRWMISTVHAAEKEIVFRKLWSNTKRKSDVSTERSFQQVLDRLGIEQAPVLKKRYLNIWKYSAAAVVIIALSVVGTIGVMQNRLNADSVAMIEHYVGNGKTEIVTLPDGSAVHLNSGSYILYPDKLAGTTRTVYLVGEAEFKVAGNPDKPFIVKSANMAVTALGTDFNVKAYPEEENMIATLLEGKVRVNCNDTTSYILTPGQQVIYNKCTAVSHQLQANMESVMAWKRGEVVFHKATISEISQTLERRYGIVFRSPKKKSNADRYNFTFKENADIEEVLNVMKIVIGGFDYELKGNICYIYWK